MLVRYGYNEIDITPESSVKLIGFDRADDTSIGINDALLAQILLFENNQHRYCLITIDSLGFTVDRTAYLRAMIAKSINETADHIMVCFSHTHSAPNVAIESKYFKYTCNSIANAIKSTLKTLVQVRISWDCGSAHIGINRRESKGIVDDRIGVLKIINCETNKLETILLRVSAHANVFSSDNRRISSDFFGETRRSIRNKYGCNVIMIQGASGNIKPRFQHSQASFMEEHPREAEQLLKNSNEADKLRQESIIAIGKMALEIEKGISKIMADDRIEDISTLSMFSEHARFTANVPSMDRARNIVEQASECASIDGKAWFHEVERLKTQGVDKQFETIEIQYFVINNGIICGIPNEAMCEISLQIKDNSKNNLLFFNGYTNGCTGYLPTEQEYRKGGYEVLWSYLVYYKYHGHVMPLNYDSAQQLVEIVSKKIRNITTAST